MNSQLYTLNFDGYRLANNLSHLPSYSGIYCVYACVYNNAKDTVSLKRLLYIGESDNINRRIKGHEKFKEWSAHLKVGEVLCFNYAEISPDGARTRAEAAMIYEHQPPVNTEFKNNFPFDQTTVSTSGRNALLRLIFTVNKTTSGLADLLKR